MSRRIARIQDEAWEYTANSPEELLRIGERESNVIRGPDQNRLDEQVQVAHFLVALAREPETLFPVLLSHTPNEVPDFQIQFAGFRVGAEVTKIAIPDVEHARALQNRGLKRTLGISSLLRRKPNRRTREEVVAEGFLIPQVVHPLSLEEHSKIWNQEVTARLDEKTRVVGDDAFRHGQEDWLILWDRLGTADWQMEERIQQLTENLEPRWSPNWFSRVVVQAGHFEWQYHFRSSGVARMQACRL